MMNEIQSTFFEEKKPGINHQDPLAIKMRPTHFNQFVGQEKVIHDLKQLKQEKPHFIFWGPPGTGKTTLAHLLANEWNYKFFSFNAVLSGIPELKKLIAEIETTSGEKILFIDEIHRFNKAQQDALLPYLERKTFNFIGATTEYPQTSINRALLSRLKVLELKLHTPLDLETILNRTLKKNNRMDLTHFAKTIAQFSNGDARKSLNALSLLLEKTAEELKNENVLNEILGKDRLYDRNNDRHYDVISAFIKSIRGSDPDAALLWLAIMLDGGEDPAFISRRLLILASEDVGLANSQALQVVVNADYVVKQIGMPEARITLSHAVLFMCLSPKSNSAYTAIDEALSYVKNQPTIEVPGHLRGAGIEKQNYKYPHSYPNHWLSQEYSGQKNIQFFTPGELGSEKPLIEIWKKFKN